MQVLVVVVQFFFERDSLESTIKGLPDLFTPFVAGQNLPEVRYGFQIVVLVEQVEIVRLIIANPVTRLFFLTSHVCVPFSVTVIGPCPALVNSTEHREPSLLANIPRFYLDVKIFEIEKKPFKIRVMTDLVDELLDEWADEQPGKDFSALGVVVRIQLLSKLLTEGADQALEDLELRHWEYDVLSALRRQGRPYQMNATELAQASLLTSGTITARIDGLEERGLVERRPCPDDRRAIQIRLTPAGRELINEAIGARLRTANEQLGALTEQQRSNLSAGLRRILSHVA